MQTKGTQINSRQEQYHEILDQSVVESNKRGQSEFIRDDTQRVRYDLLLFDRRYSGLSLVEELEIN
jgi:hypothetical protein